MLTSIDSTATCAIDGNSNSFSRSTTSSTASNCQPNSPAYGPFSGDFTYGSEQPDCHSESPHHGS
jgi:hypothetical protein